MRLVGPISNDGDGAPIVPSPGLVPRLRADAAQPLLLGPLLMPRAIDNPYLSLRRPQE